jgi:hypothetical protein
VDAAQRYTIYYLLLYTFYTLLFILFLFYYDSLLLSTSHNCSQPQLLYVIYYDLSLI